MVKLIAKKVNESGGSVMTAPVLFSIFASK